MSYVPPPGRPPEDGPSSGGPPEGGGPARGSGEPTGRGTLWTAIVIGFLASFLLPVLAIATGEAVGLIVPSLLSPLLVVLVGVILTIPERTRQWGAGLTIGFAVSLVLGAGACVVLLGIGG